MAGARIDIRVEDRGVVDRLAAVRSVMDDISPVLMDIGEYLLISTEERFVAEESPDGVPWAPLSEAWVAHKERKGRNPDKILTYHGDLRGSIRYQVVGDSLEVGTDKIYGAIHQFGGVAGRGAGFSGRSGGSVGSVFIDARPFLGLSPMDRLEIMALIEDHIVEN